jgi:hypothetical protein
MIAIFFINKQDTQNQYNYYVFITVKYQSNPKPEKLTNKPIAHIIIQTFTNLPHNGTPAAYQDITRFPYYKPRRAQCYG